MRISLILTSFDRQTDLDRFAIGLAGQSFSGELEVMFVAQGTAQLRLPESSNASTRVVNRSVSGLTPLSKARNIGLEGLTGDILCFPDDDCWYDSALCEKVAAFFAANLEIDCICTSVYDPDKGLTYGNRPLGVTCEVSFRNLFTLGSSAGIFIRKHALNRAGAYFDETLGAGTASGSGEEMELLARVLSTGCRIKYLGGLQVYHPVSDYSCGDIKKFHLYGVGFGHLNGRLLRAGHPEVMWYFFEMVGRSLSGAILKFSNPVLRDLYWNRFTGIIKGFLQAFALSRKELDHLWRAPVRDPAVTCRRLFR